MATSRLREADLRTGRPARSSNLLSSGVAGMLPQWRTYPGTAS
jgi:hypothetical protein